MSRCTRLFEAGILGEGRVSMNILDENFFWAMMENVHCGAALSLTVCIILLFVFGINLVGDAKLSFDKTQLYRKCVRRLIPVSLVLGFVACLPRAEDIRDVAFHRAVTTVITSENVEVITASVSRMVVRTECAVFGCEKK